MKQHNQVEGRKCWQTKRERDRLKARFQIRERVANPSKHETSCDLDESLVTELLGFILKGDRSKFSLALMDEIFSVLSARIPIYYIEEKLPQALQLCHAWFGREYSDRLERYINSLETFTLLEFSVWMGKYTILGSLLVGGVNPCVRGYTTSDENTPREWEQEVGSTVLKRFFDCFPLPLSSYIVTRVVQLRMLAYDKKSSICSLCKSDSLSSGPLLEAVSKCGHKICEPCFWRSMLANIDNYGDLPDVVICPVCCLGAGGTGQPNEAQYLDSFKTLSPVERAKHSLTQFYALPQNRQALKSSSRKKKKIAEQDAVAPSWYLAVKPSLGLTQEVRKDKFFSYVERNALHYIRGCLFAGVDVNWVNEYGQTALYIAVWRGYTKIAIMLLEFGADPTIVANGGSDVSILCRKNLDDDSFRVILDRIGEDFPICKENIGMIRTLDNFTHFIESNMTMLTLLPKSMDHPGAGSYVIDHALPDSGIEALLAVLNDLPMDLTQKKKNTLCSERFYFCDAEGVISSVLENVIYHVGLASKEKNPCKVFPHMRFLNYSHEGGSLAPHVDLCRIHPFSDKRSTHTLILYLSTCETGGETSLLANVADDSEILSCVSVIRGRMLLFPHACPHKGNEVVDVPKILLRGEIMLLDNK